MMKFLLIACIFATLSVAMSWELEPEYHLTLAKPQDDLSKDCSNLVLEMLDCVSFMTDGNTTKPSPECCKGLKTVLDTNEKCVCFALEDAPNMGIIINMSRAEAMPSLCHVKAPPISTCNISVSPAPSPATPAPSPARPVPAPAPAPAPVTPNPPPSPAPVSPNPPPPSAAPTPGTPPSPPTKPPSSPATPPSSPVSPTPPSSSPPSVPIVTPSTPSTEAPAQSPDKASGAMHIQTPFQVSFAVIVVSLFFV